MNVFHPAVMCLGMWSKNGEIDGEINSGNGFLYLNSVRWKIVKKCCVDICSFEIVTNSIHIQSCLYFLNDLDQYMWNLNTKINRPIFTMKLGWLSEVTCYGSDD
jgi:hypothetical protein